jgi:hypothetical protein
MYHFEFNSDRTNPTHYAGCTATPRLLSDSIYFVGTCATLCCSSHILIFLLPLTIAIYHANPWSSAFPTAGFQHILQQHYRCRDRLGLPSTSGPRYVAGFGAITSRWTAFRNWQWAVKRWTDSSSQDLDSETECEVRNLELFWNIHTSDLP